MKHKLYPAVIALCIGMLSSACSGRPSSAQTEPAVSAAEATEAALSSESPVEIDGSYILFLTPGWTEYQGQYFSEEELSPDTLKWLDNYYSLSEEEQQAISYIPSELIRQEEPPLVTEPN